MRAPRLMTRIERCHLGMDPSGLRRVPNGTRGTQIEGGWIVVETESRAPRARLKPEVQTGLKGEPLTEGLGGQWVQSYYLSTLVKAAGGTLDYEAVDELVRIRARIPA